jgi:hypothetical protein
MTSSSVSVVKDKSPASNTPVDTLSCLDNPSLPSSMSVSVNDSISGSSESSPHVGTVSSMEMMRCGSCIAISKRPLTFRSTHIVQPLPQVDPIIIVATQEPHQHARIQTTQRHLLDLFAVKRPQLLRCIRIKQPLDVSLFRIAWMRRRRVLRIPFARARFERDGGSGKVWVEVEQVVPLCADKVIRRRRPSPGDPNRLRKCKQGLLASARVPSNPQRLTLILS